MSGEQERYFNDKFCYCTLFDDAKSDPSPSPQRGEGIATPSTFGRGLG